MQLVLDGASLDDATVLNPRVEGATTFPVVVGDQLLTGHAGQVLRFWNLADGRTQLELPVSSGDSTFIAPSPDDDYLYYEDEGILVRRFPVDLDVLVDLAERRLQRDLRSSECERYRLSDDCERLLASR